MDRGKMENSLIDQIKNGQLILFLGAGASFGCLTQQRAAIPMSGDLAQQLAFAANLPYAGEPLDAVYQAARGVLGKRLDDLLEKNFKHVIPSAEYDAIARYVWRRIYTLNIDDGLDRALGKIALKT